MDDSEKSYGYSEDLYHGQRAEKSYEYSSEGETIGEESELAPEEEAIHIEGARNEEPLSAPAAARYDYGRGASYGEVESFTWENPEAESESEDSKTGEVTTARKNRS